MCFCTWLAVYMIGTDSCHTNPCNICICNSVLELGCSYRYCILLLILCSHLLLLLCRRKGRGWKGRRGWLTGRFYILAMTLYKERYALWYGTKCIHTCSNWWYSLLHIPHGFTHTARTHACMHVDPLKGGVVVNEVLVHHEGLLWSCLLCSHITSLGMNRTLVKAQPHETVIW